MPQENYRPIFLIIIDEKKLNKILVNQMQQQSKRIINQDSVQFNICKSMKVIHHINKRKGKKHMIIWIDVEKAFDKIQHPFIITTLNKVGIVGTYLNIIRAIVINAYIKTQEISQTNSWTLFLQELERVEQMKPKSNRSKETTKIRVEINEKEI